MNKGWIVGACLCAFGLFDLSLMACGSTEDFGDGGADATLPDANGSPEATTPIEEAFPSAGDSGPHDAGNADSTLSDSGSPEVQEPVDVVDSGSPDAIQDSGRPDVVTVIDSGHFCGDCDAGTVVNCMCGVKWTCTGEGCWDPDFTCSGTCAGPSMCLPPGAPVDLGVVECASGFADGGFLPCCSGSSSAFLCMGTCS